MASFLMFMLSYVTGGELTVAKVFSAYSVIAFIRLNFSHFHVHALNFIVESRLLFQRLDQIMDISDMKDEIEFEKPENSENSVEFDGYIGFWSAGEKRIALENINLTLKKNSLNAVVGPVGSGKTSLLLAFTGDIPENTGKLRCSSGKIAYVEQEPTIFAGTVRESILFGRKYNEEFYKKVVKACNLESDFKLFSQGDKSIIEEKGTNLSGGQRARLALARAVYADADIYLLDDPLSAVDAKVAKSIYDEVVLGLLKEKTVILVTHQVHFVRDVGSIIVIENNKVIGNGSFEDLAQKGVDVEKIFMVEKKEEGLVKNEEEIKKDGQQQDFEFNENENENDFYEDHVESGLKTENADPYAGKVTLKTYALLCKEVGWKYIIILIVTCIFSQFGDVAFGRILGAWTTGQFGLRASLSSLGGISLYLIVIHGIKNVSFTLGFFGASKKYHKKMLNSVIRSPSSFFDNNSVGRILGRFAGGIGILDKFFPVVGLDVFDIGSVFLGIVITLSIIDPVLLGPLAGFIIIFSILVLVLYPVIKHTKSYDISTKNPLFSHLSATISGISIIRTYGQTDLVRKKFTQLLNISTKGTVNFTLASTLMGFFIDMCYILTAIGIVYITTARIDPTESDQSGAMAGFIIALLLTMVGLFQWGVRMFCQTNIIMGAAAEVQSYCDLPSEASLYLQGDITWKQEGWPNSGDIAFNEVYMKYRPESEYIIKNLNLLANSGEKIGCVGRTGAGKSTIINLLFRLQEIDRTLAKNGSIKIDNVDTQSFGLHMLRNKISIIPQIPFIFTGTVRENIDPLGEFTDQEVWNSLAEVRLRKHVENLPEKLETNMSNASTIFSIGQRQLVCLARTLLRPSKILVLDEATANMDSETDTFIQKKIMEKFSNSTVFTIAHRLSTIADYDRVLVLDKGTKMEYDAPYKLLVKREGDMTLTNSDGFFGSMVMNTGPKASQRIVNIAKKAYEIKRKNLAIEKDEKN